MRSELIIGWVALAALGACGQGGGVRKSASVDAGRAADRMPTRRAGLWVQTMTRDGKPGRMGAMRVCLDAATDARMALIGRVAGKGACAPTVSRLGDGAYGFVSTCRMGGAGVITARGTASGDFASTYALHAESDVAGAVFPPMNGHHVTDVTARYAGACPAGMAPGDMTLGPGIKVNINRLPALAAGAMGAG